MLRSFLLLALVAVAGAASGADESATLRGRFVYDGDPPKPEAFEINKDSFACGKSAAKQDLLVDAKDGGLANVIVWLEVAEGEKPPAHPRLEKLREKTVECQIKLCEFQPRIVPLLTGQKLALTNRDPIAHNHRFDPMANMASNRVIVRDSTAEFEPFKLPEKLPVMTQCSIHPWMRGFLLIKDHPYVAVSDAHGEFAIADLPPGEWTFRAWHERCGYIQAVTLRGEKAAWEKGRFTKSLSPDSLGLGDVKVPVAVFQRK
jgi:hypothetical protein